ncbi:hypothetical protein [Acetivibrio clariflavus]|uniref:hypothetical protein n=1 Tax=Acetivibrio clariflavus TaxID=288965 RepID=UPI0005A025AF|nr:hypothetical protein [Acetivibrio clariflavus]
MGDILLKLSPIPTAKLLKKQDRKPVGGQYEKLKKVLTKMKRHVNIRFRADEAMDMDFEK